MLLEIELDIEMFVLKTLLDDLEQTKAYSWTYAICL